MSTCGRYSIHAQKWGGRWLYEALVQRELWNNMLGTTRDKAEAIGMCEAHARGA